MCEVTGRDRVDTQHKLANLVVCPRNRRRRALLAGTGLAGRGFQHMTSVVAKSAEIVADHSTVWAADRVLEARSCF